MKDGGIATGGGRRLLVIFNPTAGWRRHRKLRLVLARLEQAGCLVELVETRAAGHAEQLARAADPARHDLVVAAGGDGTINEVINGLADNPLPLAVIPLGTANVLARELGVDGGAGRAVAAILSGAPETVALGLANGRRFAIMVSAGFDAEVVEHVDGALKRKVGKLAYVAAALGRMAAYRPRSYTAIVDGRRYGAATVVVAKGRYYGGSFVVAPEARIESPWLQVAILEGGGRWNLMRYALALGMGRIAGLRDVRIVPARELSIEGMAGELTQADGDRFLPLPLTVSIDPRPLLLVRAPRRHSLPS